MPGPFALLATIGAGLSVAVLPAAALAASAPSEVQTEPAELIPGGAKLKRALNRRPRCSICSAPGRAGSDSLDVRSGTKFG
jgi:hypothetical protein